MKEGDRMRNRAWRRYKNYTKAKRKERIVHEQNDYWHYKFFGQYIKGKICCSCPMCRRKTKNKGAAAFYHGVHNYRPMDFRRIQSMNENLNNKI